MISTLLKLVSKTDKQENFLKHKELKKICDDFNAEVETKREFFKNEEISKKITGLMLSLENFKDAEKLLQLDNVLMLGVQIGIDIGKSYAEVNEL